VVTEHGGSPLFVAAAGCRPTLVETYPARYRLRLQEDLIFPAETLDFFSRCEELMIVVP
jgi:hypothetical protein